MAKHTPTGAAVKHGWPCGWTDEDMIELMTSFETLWNKECGSSGSEPMKPKPPGYCEAWVRLKGAWLRAGSPSPSPDFAAEAMRIATMEDPYDCAPLLAGSGAIAAFGMMSRFGAATREGPRRAA